MDTRRTLAALEAVSGPLRGPAGSDPRSHDPGFRPPVCWSGRPGPDTVASVMGSRILAVVASAMLASACNTAPEPSITPEPAETVTPSPSSTPLIAATVECARPPKRPAPTILCEEGVRAALDALSEGHSQVLRAEFFYQLPCPLGAHCAVLPYRNLASVVVTSRVGAELIRLVKAPDGGITANHPEPFVHPEWWPGVVDR